MTRKLYYEDPALAAFTARVMLCVEVPGGFEITLDATAFYPEGGGQPCDLGTLGGARVLDVQERGDEVIHLCDRPLNGTVEGLIDWARRFDLMQQHSGEHMVSGVICRRYGCHNVGFHIGAGLVTIDFDAPLPAEALSDIESEVNAAIWRDLPLNCWTPSEAELPGVAYRSKRALPWPVRIVEVPGVDICACCGVHVRTSGEIGLVKLVSCVKFHQGVRIEMACGGRAMKLLNTVFDQNRQVSQAFSAKILETGEAARQMKDRLAQAEYRCAGLERRIFDATAAAYANRGNVVHFEPGLSPNALRELADKIASVCGGVAAVFSPTENGHGACLVSKSDDLKALGSAMKQALGARGGGKNGYFQGSIPADQTLIHAFFLDMGWNM